VGDPEISGTDDHPVLADPELRDRLKAAAQAERTATELAELRRRMSTATNTVGRDFDRVLDVLTAYGYVRDWTLTDRGKVLAKLFHECDLLVAEALFAGLLDGLDACALAGLASVFVYEHRTPDPAAAPWFPSSAVRRQWQRILDLSDDLCATEDAIGLPVHRAPDPSFVAVAYAWAAGEGFAEVVDAEELTGGDFVRTTKQLIDLLRQIGLVAPVRATRAAALEGADRLFRGVVAASSAVEAGGQGEASLGERAEPTEPNTHDRAAGDDPPR
jgi:ATP-dependent RNA helicase HelY